MLDLLFYANMSCTDAAKIISRVEKTNLNNEQKLELIEVIQDFNHHCKWDAND